MITKLYEVYTIGILMFGAHVNDPEKQKNKV